MNGFTLNLHHAFCLVSAIKLITNRWAWALVPTKLVELGNALAWGGGIHGNPASAPHQAPSHWTIQWNTYRPNTYLAHSFRIGAATVAARNGIPDHLIQALGRWTSNAYQLYIRTPSEALAGISGQLAWHRVSLPLVIHSSFYIAVEFSTELPGACTAVVWRCSHCQLLSLGKCVCFSMQLLRLVLGVVGVGGSISPLFAGPSFFKHQGDPGGLGAACRVAMDTSSSC